MCWKIEEEISLNAFLHRKHCSKKKAKPPALTFDLTPKITIEDSIDFVVPPLQSPRTLMAGAGIYEVRIFETT